MSESKQPSETPEEANRRLEAALKERGARDPRDYYRSQLKELRAESPGGYDQAVTYYRDTLLPDIAAGTVDPLAAWTDYGRELASLRAEGRTVSVDPTGRSTPYESPADPEHLVLHLPVDRKRKALVVALPGDLSPAQRATYDWLVTGRLKLREEE